MSASPTGPLQDREPVSIPWRAAHKFFDPHLPRFANLQAGDRLVVYVCRRDPGIIKLNIVDSTECDDAAATTP